MHYSIKIGDRTYSVEIEDLNTRPVKVIVDGEAVELWPEEKSAPLPAIPAGERSSAKPLEISNPPAASPRPANTPKTVAAPIPGVIIEINVTAGQSVHRGDALCILEAMKMKNSIRAGRDGVIGSIQVSVGDQVRHGQNLMEFTE